MFDPVEAIKEYVKFPSVSTDSSFKNGMDGARAYVSNLLKNIGFEIDIIHTPLHPIILAKRDGESSWPHVIIYGHYDVQPADPLDLWQSSPFEPEIRNGYIYGRGVADNKGPLLVHIAAVARLLEKHPNLPLRITFLIEGEEEIGSPSFQGFLDEYRNELNGDFVLLSDTLSPNHDQIAITTGLRGVVCVNAEITGPKMDLHSGIHGGVLLNPIKALADICSTLHDENKKVKISGFYDDVLPVTKWESEEIAKLNKNEDDYAKFLGLKYFYTVNDQSPYLATRVEPTLEFNGIGGGYQGEGTKTVIPSKAFVKISCRIIPNQEPKKIQQLVIAAIKERCPKHVSLKIDTGHCGAPYIVTPPNKSDSPNINSSLAKAFLAADTAISDAFGNAPLYLREGGSIPIIADLKNVVGLDSLMIGMFTPENNLHAPNENFHLGMFENGIKASEKILASVAGVE